MTTGKSETLSKIQIIDCQPVEIILDYQRIMALAKEWDTEIKIVMTLEREILAAAKERKAVAKEIKAGFKEMTLGNIDFRAAAKKIQSLRGTKQSHGDKQACGTSWMRLLASSQ